MAFIDEIKFHAKAGRGGEGVVRWRHEKGKEFSGAAGGNGGRGGDVYVRAVRDINILSRHNAKKNFAAGNGSAGMNWSKHGKDGDDITIDLPLGSIITNKETGYNVELVEEGQSVKILHGGSGGLGNEYFKASTNVTPEESTSGREGESADFEVELNLIADIGLIGLPNAGKSSLLNALTNAKAKVGSYAFTTLDPNLGALPGGYIIADIPGLIEGAAEGKGLGHKFLKHVKRTRFLLHLLSLEGNADDPEYYKGLLNNYETVRRELQKFGAGLTEKREVIVLTKTDLVPPESVANAKKTLENLDKEVLAVSVLDENSLTTLKREVGRLVALSKVTG